MIGWQRLQGGEYITGVLVWLDNFDTQTLAEDNTISFHVIGYWYYQLSFTEARNKQ